MVTYSAEDYRAARQAWLDGEFGEAWDPFRAAAAERGFVYPPTGSRWDSWEDDRPSQRAVLWRAVEETPQLLLECIGRSRSWSEVIRILLARRDAWREVTARRDEEEARRRERGPSPDEAAALLPQLVAAATAHRQAQLEAAAAAAREVVRLANGVGLDDDEWGQALTTLEGLLLALDGGA